MKEGENMGRLKLPRLLNNGMVLQQRKEVRIWGKDEPGRKVAVSFLEKEYVSDVNADGEWEVFVQKTDAGGAYQMVIRDDAGEEKIIDDIVVGDVWICAGQSNMELPINRVMDRYPGEMDQCENGNIRTFKITEHREFHAPLAEHESGEWKAVSQKTLPDFSATAYFFAKHIYRMTGVPVGLINASLGGSRIESWMGRDMLEGYDDFLEKADCYRDDDFVTKRLAQNEQQANAWHERLDGMDTGLLENWEKGQMDVSEWKEIEVPFFFNDTDTELKDFIGSVWFYKEFTVGKQLAGKAMKLWLGTIVDSDTVYVNGVFAGHTDYQYPPRKYTVPEGVLQEGKNVIVIRVKSEIGQGRFTDDKPYMLFRGNEKIDLTGTWKYRTGASCGMIGETDFVSWKPTGLYQGMMAPCHPYTVAGILWYQGESNTHETADRYLDLTKRMVAGYRQKWGEELPFLYVQLPNFRVERYDADRDETVSDWPYVREAQRRALEIPGTAMITTIDIGEDNDLHPLNKEGIGFRLAMQAAKRLYGKESECEGPQIESVSVEKVRTKEPCEEKDCRGNVSAADAEGTEMAWKVTLTFSHASGMFAVHKQSGQNLDIAAGPRVFLAAGRCSASAVTDFELLDENGKLHGACVQILDHKVVLTCGDDMPAVREIRYCYRNTNEGALIYNEEGFPMTPFRISCR